MKRRVGRVTVSQFFLTDGDEESYKLFSSIFDVGHVERNPITHDFIIYGFCDAFDEIDESDIIPDYEFTFRKINDLVLISDIKRISTT